jgi:ribosome biogenesis SPOUT family RNA methylase Rps3
MKFIVEHLEQELNYLTEEKNCKKQTFIEGVFMQADKLNNNKRIYPKEVLSKATNKYIKEQVSKGRAVGELNHPDGPAINLDKVSHRITELKFEGNNVVGKALVLDTPMGNIVKGLVDGGCKLGVSSRGMGTVENKNGQTVVKDDFVLSTVDIVQDPSAPQAFVDGIMEGVEWICESGVFIPQQIEKYETEIRKASSSELAEAQRRVFSDFLSKL